FLLRRRKTESKRPDQCWQGGAVKDCRGGAWCFAQRQQGTCTDAGACNGAGDQLRVIRYEARVVARQYLAQSLQHIFGLFDVRFSVAQRVHAVPHKEGREHWKGNYTQHVLFSSLNKDSK